MMVKSTIHFIQGTNEQTMPDVKLTKSRDITNVMAILRFDEPSVFDSYGKVGEITVFYVITQFNQVIPNITRVAIVNSN